MFQEMLQKMVDRVDGAVGGILMGFDGISVESYVKPQEPTDIQTVGMELAHVIGQIRRAIELLESGNLTEVTIKADKLSVLIYALNDEYFLAFVIAPRASLGKARYVLRVVAPQIQAEL
jgi:predicted regulator of Ras-like GTPase activity (Roadblock/LC7/MglB family)